MNRRVIQIGILLLTFEKMLQHLLTAVFFVVDVPAIGRPDIGPTFQLSDVSMAALNLIVLILFGISLWGRLRGSQWHKPLLAGLALFDILAEFIFHGFFFITVSVIVALALLVLIQLDTRSLPDNPHRSV